MLKKMFAIISCISVFCSVPLYKTHAEAIEQESTNTSETDFEGTANDSNLYSSSDRDSELADTCITEGQLPDEFYAIDESVSLYSLNPSIFTEKVDKIDLNGFATGSSDFTTVSTHQWLKDKCNYGDNVYLCLQGGCFDGHYYYYAFVVKDTKGNHVDSCIIWGTMDGVGVFVPKSGVTDLKTKLQHVNDLTYNEDTGEIVIACCETGYYNMVYTIPATTLRNGTKNFTPHEISCKVSSIDYNPIYGRYVVALSNMNNAFALLDSDFGLVKTIGYEPYVEAMDKMWATQGIYSDDEYIYRLYYYDTGEYNDETENRLRIFDWDGKYVKTFEFTIEKSDYSEKRIYECENLFISKDRLLISFSCVPKTSGQTERKIAYYDLSDYMFHAQFCPDENISEYKNVYDNDNVHAMMFYGLTAPLRKFRVQVEGKKFTGWTAYRVEQNKWYYRNADDTDRAWYKEGSQPSGYTKFIYKDKANVSKTGAKGGHVLLCAQWESTSKYTVSFMKNGATGGTMSDQSITYGTSTALRTNTYTKNNRTFQFWNAYWSEKNKWYYQNADGSAKGWYKEGYQPAGYTKYVYNDQQNVSKTVTLKSYQLYRPDINKWMYINCSGTKKWYAKGDEPSGYDIYERTASSGAYLGATALPGERLVLYAIWQ